MFSDYLSSHLSVYLSIYPMLPMCLISNKTNSNVKKCWEKNLRIAVTFSPMCFGHGCGDGVSVNYVQKEVGRVVVGLAEITLNHVHRN